MDQVTETVGALMISRERRVLLGLRAPWKRAWPSHWDTIGGRVEANESLEVALVREVREEVGVTPTTLRYIASIKERRPELYGPAVYHVYAVTDWSGGEPTNTSEEHTEIRWFTIEEIDLLRNIVDCDYPQYLRLAAR
jgi:8-oxo-dGTP pyrophosphatase MutT (NUDIX family)